MARHKDSHLEEILYSYPVLKAQATLEAEELRELFPGCTARYDGVRRDINPADVTGEYAVRREARSRNIRRARAVEVACEALTAQERELVRLMYFERWGRYQIRLGLGIQRSRLFGLRRSALDKLGGILLG